MSIVDYVLLLLALLGSFYIRLGYFYLPSSDLIWMIAIAPIFALIIFTYFGLYHSLIRYIGFQAIFTVLKAITLYSLILTLAVFTISMDGFPRSIVFIYWTLSVLVISGVRVIASYILNPNIKFSFYDFMFKNDYVSLNIGRRALIYGAGDAGVQLAAAFKQSKEYCIVGFIDDSKGLQGCQISGLNIYSFDSINKLIGMFKVEEILIAVPSVSHTIRLSIINKLEHYPLVVRTLPSLIGLAQGKINVSDLREVTIKDLLGRESVEADKGLLAKNITNKVVMVTGAGGSIGSELCRQIVHLKPKVLLLYELSELALYTIDRELSNIDLSGVKVFPILGSVVNNKRLLFILKKFKVNTIYHTAAYKHVPIVEFNNSEGVINNIFGTRSCAESAMDAGVETFVLISTDKAVRPTNTMGASKRFAEIILQALSYTQEENLSKTQNPTIGTCFSIVRFGNVLGSSGSVIPLFRKQIKDGGPVTLTNTEMSRYFMTVSEAVQLVIQAGSMGGGGDIFVLDMGEPVSILKLAKKMIHLSGKKVKDEFNHSEGIEIKYIGLRPGEKIYEELLIGNNVSKTSNPKIMRAKEQMLSWNEVDSTMKGLKDAIDKCEIDTVRNLLISAIPEFKPQREITDILYEKK